MVCRVGESGPHGTAETPESYSGIDRCRRLIETGELCWERLIRARAADALVVTYEDLTAAFAVTIQRVASYISPGLHVIVPAPTTRRLSDEGSDELLGRFQAERPSG